MCESELARVPEFGADEADVASSVEIIVGLAAGKTCPDSRYNATATSAAVVRSAAPRSALPTLDRLLANLTCVRNEVGFSLDICARAKWRSHGPICRTGSPPSRVRAILRPA